LDFVPYTDNDLPPITEEDTGPPANDAAPAPAAAETMTAIAAAFLQSLHPRWHRDGKTLMLDLHGREVQIAQLWTLLRPEYIDRAREASEAVNANGNPARTQAALTLLRSYVLIAAGHLLSVLPNESEAPGQLIDDLVRFLTATRTMRADTVPKQITYWDWAQQQEEGGLWRAFPGVMFYAKVMHGHPFPDIACKGEVLSESMRVRSTKSLSKLLKSFDLIESGKAIWCGSLTRKVWIINVDIVGPYVCGRQSGNSAGIGNIANVS
jgi:hypothetical protein